MSLHPPVSATSSSLPTLSFSPAQSFFFIGIGGMGMSALAHFLFQAGQKISGSDLNIHQASIKDLPSSILVYEHSEENIHSSIDCVVYSDAIPKTHLEIQKAKALKIPIYSRAEILGAVGNLFQDSFAVSGTHGKTSASVWLSFLLRESALTPSFILSHKGNEDISHASYNKDSTLVIYEACEAFGNLRFYHPTYPIVLNIDRDHLEYFHHMDKIKESFLSFIHHSHTKQAILNGDDPYIQEMASQLKVPHVFFGLESPHQESTNLPLDVLAKNISMNIQGSHFEVLIHQKSIGFFTLPHMGIHNIYNFLPSLYIATQIYHIPVELIQKTLLSFPSIYRRMNLKGLWNKSYIWDDYAHHPTSIHLQYQTLRFAFPDRPIYVIFQPHLYSRTHFLYEEFIASLAQFQKVILFPIFHARESYYADDPTLGNMAKTLKEQNVPVEIAQDMLDVRNILEADSHQSNIFLFLGAGNFTQNIHEILPLDAIDLKTMNNG